MKGFFMARYTSSEKTRSALIDATGQLVADRGFDSITTRQIAELSGENIGSIHYHFGGKEQLFEAVVLCVAKRWQENPLSTVLEDCNLDTKVGQALAIEKFIRRNIELLFDVNVPSWHCQIIQHVMRRPSALQGTFRDAFIEPEAEEVINLLQKIDPQIDRVTATQYETLIIAPALMHIDYRVPILERLGKTTYDDDYINRLTDICIRQALNLLHLI
jgi:AcrR family transcriptional regulator